MDKKIEFLKHISLFRGLNETSLGEIAKIIVERKHKKNMVIFSEGEPGEAVFFVKKGKIKIYKTSVDGREQTLHIMGPGDVFGEVVLLDKGVYPAAAETLEDSTIGFIRNGDLENLMRHSPEIALQMLKLLAGRLRLAQAQIRDLALKDVYSRLAGKILRLAEEHGEETKDGIRLDLSLSRQEVANLVGSTRETVTRILSEWQKRGIILMDKNEITIVKPKQLITDLGEE